MSREAHALFGLGVALSARIEARQRRESDAAAVRAVARARTRAWKAGLEDAVRARRALESLEADAVLREKLP